ncbi:hypothetical protein CYLTODRAFT_441685 [Cylindrobasidium torrendii FP15055 ss-10]|uniref:Uncharacterized protein n=1 Tax=Cylindrobasidium torrendii FP15055 ss-10 TaxID=1314674 RepID=A0A0D7BK32_9AGAR|nr:hypothetical protein CYLTODRAFT_441685 [Cylindrobasidium torrendii FP15055 ss-10]
MSTTPTSTGGSGVATNMYDTAKTRQRKQVKRGGVTPITTPTPSTKTARKLSDKAKPPILSTPTTREKSKKSTSTAPPAMMPSPSKVATSKTEPSPSRNPVPPTTPRSPRKTRASRKSETSHIPPRELDVSSTSASDYEEESPNTSPEPLRTGRRVEGARRMQIPRGARRPGKPITLALSQREPREPVPAEQEPDQGVFDSSAIHNSDPFVRSPGSPVERMDPADIAKKTRQVEQDLKDRGADHPTKTDTRTNAPDDTANLSSSHDEDSANGKPENRIRKRVSSDLLANLYVAEEDGALQTVRLPNSKRRRCKSNEDSAQPDVGPPVEEDIHELADAER